MKARIQNLIDDIRANRPLCLGLTLAVFLFALFSLGLMQGWSAMGYSYQFDYNTLGRCGLAIRHGTNIYNSHWDYRQYGNHCGNWSSLPGICLLLGTPISFLSPDLGFWVMNVVYLLCQLAVLIMFGLKLRPTFEGKWRTEDYVAFAGLGFFFPMFIIYVLGQYHMLVVLALGLILYSERTILWGFLLSAMGKPMLAPGVLALLIGRRWRTVAILGVVCALAYVPWVVLDYNVVRGLHFGSNRNWMLFYGNASSVAKFSVHHWNQEMGWSKVFEDLFPPLTNLAVRQGMALTMLAGSAWLAWKGKLREAFCVVALIYLTSQGRSHEYHLTLYVPLLAYLYTREDGAYRTRWTVALILLAACPTVFPLFKWIYGYPENLVSTDRLIQLNRPLHWFYLVQKPIVSLLTFGTIVAKDGFGVSRTS